MKLLIIFPSTQRGGTEEHALTIASAAVEEGWEVHAAFPKTNQTTSLIQDLHKKGVDYHRLVIGEDTNTQGVAKVIQPWQRVAETFALLIKVKPDLVMFELPSPHHCFTSIMLCGLLRIPTVVVFHLIAFELSFSQSKLKAYAWAKSRNQKWMTVSEYNRKLICDIFQISPDKLLCIYNGIKINSTTINSTHEDMTRLRYQVRQELGLPETSKILLTVARLHPQKGYNYLIPAIPQIIQEFPDVKFVWVGDGEQREYLVNQLKEYGVEDYVMFLGYRPDVPRLLKSADLFVFPTYSEGLPFAILEAMASGLPIVSSDTSSIPEIIENKIHGLLFSTGDSCDLGETLCWAIRHPDQMEEMARNACQRVLDFSEDKMIEETLTLLHSMC